MTSIPVPVCPASEGAWRSDSAKDPASQEPFGYCMVFLQHYHAEVSLNIPTRDRWTAHTSELLGPATIGRARIGGFPRLQDGSGCVAFLQQPSGGRVVDRLPSLLINESAPHPPQAPNRRSQASPVALASSRLSSYLAPWRDAREARESNLHRAWEMRTWLDRYPD